MNCKICGKQMTEEALLVSKYWRCPDEDLHFSQKMQPPPIPYQQQETQDGDLSAYEDIFLNGLKRTIKRKLRYTSQEIDRAIEDMMDAIRTERGMLSGNDVFEYEKDLIDWVNQAESEDLEMVLRPHHYGIMADNGWPTINWDMD